MIYYGKHQSNNPESRAYLGGGELLIFAQYKLGRKYFTKEVVKTFSDVEYAEEAEEMIVDADFIGSLNNFNLALGSHQVSVQPSLAHPLKIRLLEWARDLKKADWDGVPVWLYRKRVVDSNKVFKDVMLISVLKGKLRYKEGVMQIEAFISSSVNLEIIKNSLHKHQGNDIRVYVVNFKNPYEVICELIDVVKISGFISSVRVKFRGSSETQFRLSYSNNVYFSRNGKLIKKEIATNLIKCFN
ncbi:MAG: hypothetical protein HRT55_01730 [Colwellia sp.]|uniref:hypothetical protein n=1 Tax=Alteromonadales TaxID=135622 RepID=UPI001D375C35|nr:MULTISPECIES: hypothetical protein [Alteromonadales]NQZ25021.1 hypothetical protein [Colwellia sp.]NRA81378.1 hypothetical protein [Pseudoalteromonas sp.]